MSRRAATALHLALVLLGVVLYVVFVLPRWWVLTGDITPTLATLGRLAAGLPIGLAALPVWTMLRQALTPKARTPELALRLRAWSAVLHVLAGALILLAAIVEIWLSLEAGGPYLFAVYGAAAAIAILAVLALYLSFVAEKPPAEPKPAKPPKTKPAKPGKVKAAKASTEKKPRGKTRAAKPEAAAEIPAPAEIAAEAEADTDHEAAAGDSETIVVTEAADSDGAATVVVEDSAEPAAASQSATGSLRNKRPAGKSRRRPGR